MENEIPVFTANVSINTDKTFSTYSTSSYIEVAEQLQDQEIPRDIILALVLELENLIDSLVEKGEIESEELEEFTKERECISETNSSNRDKIDEAIDHLFDDDEDED